MSKKVTKFELKFPTCPVCGEETSEMDSNRSREDDVEGESRRFVTTSITVTFYCSARATWRIDEGSVWKWRIGCPKAMSMAMALWPETTEGPGSAS